MARFAGTAHLYSETIPIAHNNNRNGAELDQLAILRITKNLKQEGREERQQRDPRHEAWVERVITANGVLQDITNDEEWKLLLGGKYEACMLLTAVRSEAGGGGSGSGGGDGGEGGRLVVFS